jgi:hypothetical protein
VRVWRRTGQFFATRAPSAGLIELATTCGR